MYAIRSYYVGVSKASKTASVSGTPVITDIAGVGKQLDIAKAPRAIV